MNKVEKNKGPFRYDLSQIPHNYIVEVMNRFKDLGLVARVTENLWMEVPDNVYEAVTKISLITFFAAKDKETLYSQQKQDLELTVAQTISSLLQKFRLKLKKVGKTTRAFRYDINQIP